MIYFLSALYVLLSCSGLVLFKLGSESGLGVSLSAGMFELRISLLSILGMICYISSFLLYLVLVSKTDLSKIYPITTGCIFIGVMAASFLVLHEAVSWPQVVGSCLILVGILLINLF